MAKQTTDLVSILRDLLMAKAVRTQSDIQAALEKLGIEINQSKISRSLHKLGAVKTKNAQGQVVYQLPKEPTPPQAANLTNLITNIVHNEILIIVHTSPGSASLIARLLDHNQEKLNILGTVAGDDTIIVIPESSKKTLQTLQAIKEFLKQQ